MIGVCVWGIFIIDVIEKWKEMKTRQIKKENMKGLLLPDSVIIDE